MDLNITKSHSSIICRTIVSRFQVGAFFGARYCFLRIKSTIYELEFTANRLLWPVTERVGRKWGIRIAVFIQLEMKEDYTHIENGSRILDVRLTQYSSKT